MSKEPVQPIPPENMLGDSDWDDEDLLTVVEASERLVDEIRLSRERIRQSEEVLTGADGAAHPEEAAALAAERGRLEDLIKAAERIKAAQAAAPR